ncbi:MAG: hypothetical protein ACK5IQ_11000 [Bacteroidales bacterium]
MVLLLSVGIFFIDCEGSDSSSTVTLQDNEIYERVGIEHNEGLDFILEGLERGSLSDSKRQKSGNIDDIYEKVEQLTMEYMNTKSTLAKGNEELTASVLKSVDIKNLSKTKNTEVEYTSETQGMYMGVLYSIVNDSTLDLEQSLQDIKNLETQISKECEDSDKHVLLSATSVARHSMEYWHNNYGKWITKLCSTPVSPDDNDSTRLKTFLGKLPKNSPFHNYPDGLYAWSYHPACYVEVSVGEAFLLMCPPGALVAAAFAGGVAAAGIGQAALKAGVASSAGNAVSQLLDMYW